MNQVMISLDPVYGKLVLSGSKTVELRSRIVRIKPYTKVWIYVKSPVGKVVAQADVEQVIHDHPSVIWNEYREQMCIDRAHFEDYVGDRCLVSAIVMQRFRKLDEPVSIGGIRHVVSAFQPPQFYSRIAPDSLLFRILNNDIELCETV